MHPLILGIALFVVPDSPFNSYAAFLSPRELPGTCTSGDLEQFRNRTYAFRRDDGYPADDLVRLTDGKFIEMNPLGTPEWETSLVSAESVSVAGGNAVLLVIGAVHLNGTGSSTHVLLAQCRDRKLVVLFEAVGEGVRDVTFTANRGLRVKRWLWSSTDAHCCPSKEAEERYRWSGRAGRFERSSGVRHAPR